MQRSGNQFNYAEISLYILCVFVGVSGNDDRGKKCVCLMHV